MLLLFNCSVISDSVTPWTAAQQAFLSFTISQSLLKLMSTESVMPSNHLILSCPLLLLPSGFPSIRVFSNELALHIRWPKHWSFSFSISFPNEYSGFISFRIDWFDILAVQGTLKNILQHYSLSMTSCWNRVSFLFFPPCHSTYWVVLSNSCSNVFFPIRMGVPYS